MKGKIITHFVEQHHEKDCQHDKKKNLQFIYMQFYFFICLHKAQDIIS